MFEATKEALKALLDDMNIGDKHQLVENILPGTIPYVAATGVVDAMRRKPGARVALVDVASSETAQRIVRRAVCCRQDISIELPPSAQTFEEAYEEILAKITRGAGFTKTISPGGLDKAADKIHIVILLERSEDGLSGSVIAKLLKQLQKEFGPVLVVVAVGERSNDSQALGVGDVEVIETTIDPDLETNMNDDIRLLKYQYLGVDPMAGYRR